MVESLKILIIASPRDQANRQFVSQRRNPHSRNITWLDASWGSAASGDWMGFDLTRTKWAYFGIVDGEKVHRLWERYGPPITFAEAIDHADPI